MLVVCAIIFLGLIIEADAQSYTHIGIELTDSCLSLISTGDIETCRDYPYLDAMYSETKPKESYQKLIEQAELTDKTHYQMNNILLNHKIQCVSKDYCNIFEINKNHKVLYWFSPDDKVRPYLDILIRIHPNLLHKNIDQTLEPISGNYTSREISFEVNRLFVYPSCRIADYTPEILYRELGGLIYYMLDNCLNDNLLGKLKPKYTEPLDKHILDIETSPNWQYAQKLKQDIERCKLKC